MGASAHSCRKSQISENKSEGDWGGEGFVKPMAPEEQEFGQ